MLAEMLAGAMAAIPAGVVSVASAPYEFHNDNPGALSIARITFNSDGSGLMSGNVTADAAFGTGEWNSMQPATGIGARFEVRCASVSLGGWTNSAASVGTWIDISSDRTWDLRQSALASPGGELAECTFEIRYLGQTAAAASFSVLLYATN